MKIVIRSLEHIDVQSESDPAKWYVVNSEEATCECAGFLHRGGCKHLSEVARELELFEGVQEGEQGEGVDPNEVIEKEAPEIYTARYLSYDLLSSGLVIPVGISMLRPPFDLPYELAAKPRILRPEWAMCGDWWKFSPMFWKKLEGLGPELIARRLGEISRANGEKAVALCCFEDVSKDRGHKCHRTVFSFWWEEVSGYKVYELTNEGEILDHYDLHKQSLPIRPKD